MNISFVKITVLKLMSAKNVDSNLFCKCRGSALVKNKKLLRIMLLLLLYQSMNNKKNNNNNRNRKIRKYFQIIFIAMRI